MLIYNRVGVTVTACDDRYWMERALDLAEQAWRHGEVPVGAIIIADGASIASGYNTPIAASDPTAHAEIVALRAAALVRNNYRLPGTTLYVTLEPCVMCAGAILHARVERVVYAAHDPKAGAAGSAFSLLPGEGFNHQVQLTSGVLAERAGMMLSDFFKARRRATTPDRSPDA